jgi:hypothetical protein
MTLELSTPIAPDDLPLRACQCSFCLRHGAKTTSDPAGAIRILLTNCEAVSYYQFGAQTAEFLICQRCGIYLAAIFRDGGRIFAVANANTFETPLKQNAVPVDYKGETVDERRERWCTKWTPANLVENWGTFSQRIIR